MRLSIAVICLFAVTAACGGCGDENNGTKSNDNAINSMAKSCADIECAPDASCDDSGEMAVCSCLPGFEGNGFDCEPIVVACTDDSDCGDNGTCVDEQCECGDGYALDVDGCQDTDECAVNLDDCADNATCTNTPGSFQCTCDAGYQGDGTSCTDFNECAAGADDCSAENATCINTEGGFECGCSDGYTGDGQTCSVLVDCNASPDACDPDATCTDTPDGTACVCNEGLAGDGATCRHTRFTVLRAGRGSTCGLRPDGTMSCWGLNVPGASNETYLGNIATRPVDNPSGATWSHLGTGFSNWCAVLESDQTLWCSDGEAFNQVGTQTGWVRTASSTEISDLAYCAVKDDGTLWCWGNNDGNQLGMGPDPMGDTSLPQQVGTDTDWMTVDLGRDNACALKTDRTLWCWGDGANGTDVERPTQVSADADWESIVVYGDDYCARKVNGGVWCHGRDASDGLERVESVLWRSYGTAQTRACGVREDGSLWCRGEGSYGENGSDQPELDSFEQVGSETNWESVVLGPSHTCALDERGAAWCFGSNRSGQLGIGVLFQLLEPERVDPGVAYRAVEGGLVNTCALRQDGALVCAGAIDGRPAFEPGGTYVEQLFAQKGSSTDWAVLAKGWQHLCAIQTDGSLWCGGFNGGGQLGVGRNSYPSGIVQVGSDMDWALVAAGSTWTLGLRDDGSLYAWGTNSAGQLGLGDSFTRWEPAPVGTDQWKTIAAAGPGNDLGHSCGIQSDDTLWCWGDNASYQLGDGTTQLTREPTQVDSGSWASVSAGLRHSCAVNIAGELWCAGTMPDQQMMTWTRVTPDTDWDAVAAGESHTCGLKTDGTLWCWGDGSSGQLGLGSIPPDAVTTPMQVGAQSNWIAIGLGSRTSFGIQADGSLWAWGANRNAQLGTGDMWSTEPLSVLE